MGLRNLLRQFPSPGVLRPPNHFGNGTGPGVLGLLHRVRAFRPSLQPSARLQPGHGPILRITSCSPTFGFRLTIISGRQMCAPCTRTNARFCRIAPFVQSSRFLRIRFSCRCQAYPSIFAHLFIVVKSGAALTPVLTSHVSHPAERLTSPIHTLFYPMSVYCFFSWLTLKLVSIYTLGLIRRFAMASSSPTTSIPIQEPVFLQFLHDVHHAYLLLHRAMALLPPTLIPNIEPTPLPSTDVWNQPDGLRPHYSDRTNAFIDTAHIPSPDIAEEEALMDELLETHLPEPHHHVAAPSPEVLPAPSKLSTTTPSPPNRKQKAKAVPKVPAKRRRRLDKSRSRSSSPLSIWTFEDKQKLRTLKADEKSRFSWRVISTKMGKSEEDVRSMWNKIKDRLG